MLGICKNLDPFVSLLAVVHLFYCCRYPCFQCPYALDIHESPVTCMKYLSDCASDLIPAFYSCGTKQKRKGFSEKVRYKNEGFHKCVC